MPGPVSFEGPRRLQGLTDSWPLLQLDQAGLFEHFGDLQLRLRPCSSIHEYGFPGPSQGSVSLRDYFAESSLHQGHMLFENDFQPVHHRLLASGLGFEVPRVLENVHTTPVFSAGGAHTGIGFHRHNESWLAQVSGRKTWLLLPPGCSRPPILPPWWYLQERPPGLRVCTLEPGEVLYLPANWWHATWNLDDFTVAVGWEGGASKSWDPTMRAVAAGDVARLGAGFSDVPTPPMVALAARSGHGEVMRWLIEEDADLTLRKDAAPAFLSAARVGHVEILELLAGYRTAFEPDSGGRSALHHAAHGGHAAAVEFLIGRGADVRMRDKDGAQPLQLAAAHGQIDAMKALLAAGGDPHAFDSTGSAPLPGAAFNGHQAAAELLLRAGADPAAKDPLGMAPLHLAAIRGQGPAAEALLAAGAKADVRDGSGRTPLHLAAHGYQDPDDLTNGIATARDANAGVTKVLLKSRADFRARDLQGRSPMEYAVSKGHLGVAQLLQQAEIANRTATAAAAAAADPRRSPETASRPSADSLDPLRGPPAATAASAPAAVAGLQGSWQQALAALEASAATADAGGGGKAEI